MVGVAGRGDDGDGGGDGGDGVFVGGGRQKGCDAPLRQNLSEHQLAFCGNPTV